MHVLGYAAGIPSFVLWSQDFLLTLTLALTFPPSSRHPCPFQLVAGSPDVENRIEGKRAAQVVGGEGKGKVGRKDGDGDWGGIPSMVRRRDKAS